MDSSSFSWRGQPIILKLGMLALVMFLCISNVRAEVSAGGNAATSVAAELTHDALQDVSSIDAQSTTNTLRFPANALNYDKTSTVISQAASGLEWKASFASPAYLVVPRPSDWDGTSDVTLRLYFRPMTNTSGNVQFFIRPRAYNSGDAFGDAGSLSGDAVAVSQAGQIREQVITIPAARFGTKKLWTIAIQRQGAQETYADDVTLMSLELDYTLQPTTSGTIGFPANALNYDKTSTVISQAATGLEWKASFASPAYLVVPRPSDWDGTSDVTLRLYFRPMTNTSGNVQFFVRPRAYNPGDAFGDAPSLRGDAVPVSQAGQIREEVITIPAARFGTKKLWTITIQRQGMDETYADDVTLMSVELGYTAQSTTSGNAGFPANALNYDKASTVITQAATGLEWKGSFASPAYLVVPRPSDWDGTSDVTLRLYFRPMTNTSGNVQFFVRPRAYNPGDAFGDAPSLRGDAVPVSQAGQIREEVITIPAARFGTKKLWTITIQRQGMDETYADDVTLMSVELGYTAQPMMWMSYLPLVTKE